jgi:hypothetical protein
MSIMLEVIKSTGEIVTMEFPSYKRLWKVYKRLQGICKMNVW